MELNYNGSGTIYYNENAYNVDLYVNEDEGGILIKISIDNPMASFLEFPFSIYYLSGELNNGFKFSLINCSRQNMSNLVSEGRSVYSYSAQYMLKGVGGKNSECPKLYKVHFEMTNILKWGNISGYMADKNHTLSTNNNTEKNIYEDELLAIKYIVRASFLPFTQYELLEDEIILSQNSIIEITFKQEDTIDKFNGIFQKIKRLIQLCTLREIHLNNLIGLSHSLYDVYGEKRIERNIQIISSDLYKIKNSSNKALESWKWLSLQELINNDSFKHYFSKYELLKPIIELYIEIFNPNYFSATRVFLNLVQALETYHSRFKTNNIEDFKARIKSIILKNRPKEFVQDDTDFLMAKSHGFITLESRLADLLLAEFQMVFDTGDIDYKDFPNVIAITRNYYIHYDETLKQRGRVLDVDELSIYNVALICILDYYLMKELGFADINEIREKLRNRWGRVSETLEIIKASKEAEAKC